MTTIEKKNDFPLDIFFTWSPAGVTIDYTKSYIYFFYKVIYILGDKCFKKLKYEIYPEINASGNIHYHGQFVIPNKSCYVSFYKMFLTRCKNFGFVVCKKAYNKGYCEKDKEIMRRFFNKSVVDFIVPLTEYTFNDFKQQVYIGDNQCCDVSGGLQLGIRQVVKQRPAPGRGSKDG